LPRFFFLIALYLLTPAAVLADTSNKWRIKVDGGANSDGEMIFHVTPKNGETIVVRVTMKNGTGENRVAKTIRDAFEVQLLGDLYHVEDTPSSTTPRHEGCTSNKKPAQGRLHNSLNLNGGYEWT